jgi:hypothetical protein
MFNITSLDVKIFYIFGLSHIFFYVHAMIMRNNIVVKRGFNTSWFRMEATWWPLTAFGNYV